MGRHGTGAAGSASAHQAQGAICTQVLAWRGQLAANCPFRARKWRETGPIGMAAAATPRPPRLPGGLQQRRRCQLGGSTWHGANNTFAAAELDYRNWLAVSGWVGRSKGSISAGCRVCDMLLNRRSGTKTAQTPQTWAGFSLESGPLLLRSTDFGRIGDVHEQEMGSSYPRRRHPRLPTQDDGQPPRLEHAQALL